MKPEVIIFDEPSCMLDPEGRKSIIDIIYKLNKNENITIILVTHFMNEAILSDKIVVMKNGKIESIGNPENIFSESTFYDYISPMQSFEILSFIKNLGFDVNINKFESSKCAKEIIKVLKRSIKND